MVLSRFNQDRYRILEAPSLWPGPMGPAKEKRVCWNPFESCIVCGCWELNRKLRLRGER
jgi:hypothetical protein